MTGAINNTTATVLQNMTWSWDTLLQQAHESMGGSNLGATGAIFFVLVLCYMYRGAAPADLVTAFMVPFSLVLGTAGLIPLPLAILAVAGALGIFGLALINILAR